MSSLNHLVSPAGHHWPSPRYMPRGVARIQPMLTRRGGTFWILCASLAVFCYLMLLDEHSVNHFRAFAAASPDPVTSDGRGVVDMMNDVARAQSIIVAVVTLLFARLVDAHSRELVYGISLFFYVLGHILGASSRNAGGDALVASMIFHIIGQTGLLFVTDVVLADITSLQWRGFAIALPMLPYTLNAYVAAQFSIGVINGPGWVWGYGIFAITVPVALLPVLLVLSSTGRRSIKAMKVENRGGYGNQAFFAKLMSFDPVGLVLIAAIFGLVSYPPQLVPNSVERLSQPKLVAMILVGTCCLPLFLLWEWFNPYASLIPKRIMTNRAVICAVMLVFFTRLAIALRDMHAAILVVILSSWPSAQSSWFISMQWVSLTFFAVVAGLVIRSIHRVKYVTFVGVLVRLIALGMQIGAVTPSTTTAHWFAMEALAGLGGACIDIGARVGSQASASHSDLAMVVAIVRLSPVLGASFAQIIGTAVVQADPVALAISQLQYIDGQDPGVGAYRSILRKLFIIAFSLSVPCIGFALCLPDPYLGDTHNLVDNKTQSETATKESIPSQHVVEKGDKYLHATAQP